MAALRQSMTNERSVTVYTVGNSKLQLSSTHQHCSYNRSYCQDEMLRMKPKQLATPRNGDVVIRHCSSLDDQGVI